MRKASMLEKFLNFAFHKATLATTVLFFLVIFQSPISFDRPESFQSKGITLNFSQFSPAFAAFEDEYLFVDTEAPLTLQAGISQKSYQVLTQSKPEPKIFPVKVHEQKTTGKGKRVYLGQFDGGTRLDSLQVSQKKTQHLAKPAAKLSTPPQNKIAAEELKFGSLAALVQNKPPVSIPTPQNVAKKIPPKKVPQQQPQPEEEPGYNANQFDSYKVKGMIRLKDGLAFLGSMEVSWVVGDYEMAIGSINGPDATYEIEVKQLIGDVIISLYDNKDELIGEGLLDLTRARMVDGEIVARIDVLPIDWDHAGTVIDNYSLGSGVRKPVEGAQVALYAFNEAATSDAQGNFNFYNWKKTNSRTLAIASKDGYRDSVFLLDSKKDGEVILFRTAFIEAFFGYLEDLGIYEVEGSGTVFGRLQAGANLAGYKVRLGKSTPIYFQESGLASIDQSQTASNGLFAFVGLQDGDYELFIEKDGQVLDHRILAVEQGKMSPVLIDLRLVRKHLEFFDPMEPETNLDEVEVAFFDGAKNHKLDKKNRVRAHVNGGHDPALMDFATADEITRTFISRNKGLQRVPFLQNSKILSLAEDKGFEVEEGLLIGFVSTDEPYRVIRMEGEPESIIYFDENGSTIDPNNKVPYGFMVSGFESGLSSITILRQVDDLAIATDLVYSDHNSVSVTHIDILSP